MALTAEMIFCHNVLYFQSLDLAFLHFHQALIILEDVPLVEFMYFVFTGMPGESYGRSLLSVVLVLRISSAN